MSEKHTASPWRTDPEVGDESVVGADGIMVADCAIFSKPFHRRTSAINRANARLIAAAPDLLAALEAAVECGMVPVSSAEEGGANKYVQQVLVADMIRAAIAKARGDAQ